MTETTGTTPSATITLQAAISDGQREAGRRAIVVSGKRRNACLMRAAMLKTRNAADGRRMWVSVGADRKVMVFERDIHWISFPGRRGTKNGCAIRGWAKKDLASINPDRAPGTSVPSQGHDTRGAHAPQCGLDRGSRIV